MKPPPPPIVSMRYLAPGASVLNPHLMPAALVISTNSTGLDSLAACLGSSCANRQETLSVKMSQTRRIVFMGTLTLFTNWDALTFAFRLNYLLQSLPSRALHKRMRWSV